MEVAFVALVAVAVVVIFSPDSTVSVWFNGGTIGSSNTGPSIEDVFSSVVVGSD